MASVLTMLPDRSEACQPSGLLGRVKSVIETEALVDPTTGKIGQARLADRIDVSKDGGIVEMTVNSPGPSAEPTSKSTAHFESGRPVREIETVNGKAVSTTTCSYDAHRAVLSKRELNPIRVNAARSRRMSMVQASFGAEPGYWGSGR